MLLSKETQISIILKSEDFFSTAQASTGYSCSTVNSKVEDSIPAKKGNSTLTSCNKPVYKLSMLHLNCWQGWQLVTLTCKPKLKNDHDKEVFYRISLKAESIYQQGDHKFFLCRCPTKWSHSLPCWSWPTDGQCLFWYIATGHTESSRSVHPPSTGCHDLYQSSHTESLEHFIIL